MDIQARKLNVIEYLINLKDESLFQKIETLIQSKKSDEKFLPFTQQQFIDRAIKANADYSAGRVLSQEELEAQSENW